MNQKNLTGSKIFLNKIIVLTKPKIQLKIETCYLIEFPRTKDLIWTSYKIISLKLKQLGITK